MPTACPYKKEARAIGATYYSNNKPCRKGHESLRRTKTGACVACLKEATIRLFNKSPHKKYEYTKRYNQKYSHKVAAYESGKRARKKLASKIAFDPEDKLDIEVMYLMAKLATEATGISHQVDHIVPLQGQEVSGLHVPWNLQVIPAKDNQAKNNRLPKELNSVSA